MGIEPHRAVSPDGRIWRIERLRERPSFTETKNEPFFWPSLVVTFALVAVIVRLVIVDPASPMMFFFVLPLFTIWALERGAHLLRPRIRASTEGPPPLFVVWKTSRRRGYKRLERKAIAAIEAGIPNSEPPGLRLVQIGAKPES